jgi:hypothetical protein
MGEGQRMNDTFDFIDTMLGKPDDKFDWSTQLKVGERGEADFARLYQKDYAPRKGESLAYDFRLNTGETVELKTDEYSMKETPNFFMEEISDVKTGKLGGPFRAFKDGVTYFVYYFIQDRMFFWFNVAELHAHIQHLMNTRRFNPKFIKNRGWESKGYAMNRDLFNPVLIHQDQFPLDALRKE